MDGKNNKYHFLRGKIISGRVYPEFFALNRGDRVINIGCGEGPQAVVYAGQFREMIGIDINRQRIEKSREAMWLFKMRDYTTVIANVEQMPFRNGAFDKAIAVDIAEHVQSPQQLCQQAHRILKENGEILITFPTMHDKYTGLVTTLVRVIKRSKRDNVKSSVWNPDAHNQSYSVGYWKKIVEEAGFELTRARASTMFPPLHLYGIPRFWFASDFIHRIDSWFCRQPLLRNYGQALVCVFRKKDLPRTG